MLIQFYKYNIKKKKAYNSLLLYFIFLQFKVLYFLKFFNIKFIILYFKNNTNFFKYIRINSSHVLTITKNIENKNIFNIFKNNLLLLFSNNLLLLENNNNKLLENNLVMICLNYFFINVKYFKKINILYKLLKNNFMTNIIFLLKIFIIIKNYIYCNIKNNNIIKKGL